MIKGAFYQPFFTDTVYKGALVEQQKMAATAAEYIGLKHPLTQER
ncbi:hypothetical protein [Bacillus sp. V3B]|nr:hypothetical protein [Bacillus sp. V3B]